MGPEFIFGGFPSEKSSLHFYSCFLRQNEMTWFLTPLNPHVCLTGHGEKWRGVRQGVGRRRRSGGGRTRRRGNLVGEYEMGRGRGK